MKTKTFILAAIAFIGIQSVAMATTIKDIANCNGNVICQEQTAQRFVSEHPDSDKGHYVLAQIEATRGNFKLADSEIRKAESITPSLTFTGNMNAYNNLKSKISSAVSRQNSAYVAPTQSYSTNSKVQQRIEVKPTQNQTAYVTPKSPTSYTWLWILLGVSAVGVIAYVIYSSKVKGKEEKKAQTEQMSQLNEMSETLRRVLITTKTDGLPILDSQAQQAQEEVTSALQKVKSGQVIADYQLTSLSNKIRIIKGTADSGKDWSSAKQSQVDSQPDRQQSAGYNNQGVSQSNSYVPTQQTTYVQPQTVIVGNNNSGFVDGLIVGEMLHSHNHHNDNDYDNYGSRRNETVVVNNYNTSYSEPSSNSLDLGGDDSSSTRYESNSNVDFGGSDSSSDTVTDFGGSDSSSSDDNN